MSDVLKKLGLEPDDEEHPADDVTLQRLGLRPEIDEHPATRQRMLGSRPLEEWEVTPGAKGPAAPPQPSTLQRVHQAIDPSTIVPAVASKVGSQMLSDAGTASGLVSQGMTDITEGRPATGVGNIVTGGLGVPGSLLTGPMHVGEEELGKATGNPEFASRAALFAPVKVGGPTVGAAVHNLQPTTRALDIVAERMTPEQIARLQSNPRLRPMDVSKGVRDLGVGIAKDTSQPRAMGPVVKSMETSAANAKDAVRGTYNETMGEAPNLYAELERLKEQSRTVGRKEIQPRLDNAKPVDTSPVIDSIDKALNPTPVKMSPGTTIPPTPLQQELIALRRDLANDKEVLTDPNRLHEIQSELRRSADELLSSATGSDRRLGRQLMDYRNSLVGAIDKSAPGYKEALGKYKDTIDVHNAFDFGRGVLQNTKDVKTDPSYLAEWVKKASPEELEAAKLGARQAIEAKMGAIKSSALDPGNSGTSIPQVDFNRQKLETLFGKESTEKMFRHLQDERDIAVTNSRGLANSTTAEAQAAQKSIQPREISQPHSQLPSWALAMGAGAGALTSPTVGALVGGGLLGGRAMKAGYDWVGRQTDLSRNASIGQIISRNDPETIAGLVRAMDRVERRNKLTHLIAPP